MTHKRMSPLMEEIRLKAFRSPDWTVVLSTLLSDGDSRLLKENMLKFFGTPVITCLKVTGSAV